MKKLLFALCLTLLTTLLFAQNKPTSFGITGGLNLTRLYTTFGNSSGFTRLTTGPYVGVFVDARINDRFSIRPNLMYTTKGGSEKIDEVDVNAKITYIELPVNLVFHTPVPYGEYFIAGGPYFSYGLTAKAIGSYNNMSETQDIGFDKADGGYKRGDVGANLMIGLKLTKGFMITLGSDVGITNISNLQGVTTRTRTTNIGIGYQF